MRFSSSMLSKFMTCGLQAKFSYVDKLRGPQSASATFGTCVHEALELYNDPKSPTRGDVEAAVDRFIYTWDHPEELGVAPDIWNKRTSYGQLKQTGIQCIRDYDAVVAWSDREVLAVEHRFYVPFGKHHLSGMVDVVEINADGIIENVDLKAQPLDAKVLTPGGWTTIGQLKVGDQVIGSNGSPTTVNGVYPQGLVQPFRIGFNDGSSTTCSSEHYWTIRDVNPSKKFPRNRTVTLADINALPLKRGTNNRFFVPVISEPVSFIERCLPVDPYILGCILADGGLTGESIRYSKSDTMTVDKIKSLLPPECILTSRKSKLDNEYTFSAVNPKRNPIRKYLDSIGLMGKGSLTKFIPSEYLLASREQRKALLAGLVDGDGCTSGRNKYSTSSEALKDGVLELCRSLGGSPIATPRDSYYVKGGKRFKGAKTWDISLRVPDNPFSLPRKAEGWTPPKNTLERAITSIVPLEGEVEMVCIKVSNSDGLYVTDDYIVTHNTAGKRPTYDTLHMNSQFTTYDYASRQKEFWLGTGGDPDDHWFCPPMENGEELWERFKDQDRRAIWWHLRQGKPIYVGPRDDADYMRLYRCCEEIEKAMERDVFIPSIGAESCLWCDFSDICPLYIPNAEEVSGWS